MAKLPKNIRNFKKGLEKNVEPINIAEDAFASLINAYQWRGSVRKKFGASHLGRFRRNLTSIDLGSSLDSPWEINTIFTSAIPPLGVGESNKTLVPGSVIITVGSIIFSDDGLGNLISVTPGNSGSINYASGVIELTHTAGSGQSTTVDFSYYPGLPVMALPNRRLRTLQGEQLIGFDTKYSYIFNNGSSQFQEAPSNFPVTWSGTNADFFWSENAFEALWTTNGVPGLQGADITTFSAAVSGPPSTIQITTSTANNFPLGSTVWIFNAGGAASGDNLKYGTVTVSGNPFTLSNPTAGYFTSAGGASSGMVIMVTGSNDNGDGIRWYAPVSGSPEWVNFNPPVNDTTVLVGASIVVYYRDRIVCLDTYESNSTNMGSAIRYPQRARWSQNGTPFYVSPVPDNSQEGVDFESWNETIPGRGSWIDAPTTEQITGATFLRDTLVVRFEESTWKLRYTNNELLPFVWERLNVELGADSLFSGVKFDQFVLAVGNRGITACDGVGVNRLDLLIPDEVFNFSNSSSGPERIHGCRSYEEQLVYWIFPNDAEGGTYPNRVLVYNYIDGSWGILRDSWTCYGNWKSFSDLTWANATMTWASANFAWQGRDSDALQPLIIAGNQLGYVSIVESQVANSPALNILEIIAGVPGILKIQDHNLSSGERIQLHNFLAPHEYLNGLVLQIEKIDENTVALYYFDTVNRITIPYTIASGSYIGSGEASRVDNFQILTKKFNPYLDSNQSCKLNEVNFYVTATGNGRFAVNLYADDQNDVPANLPSSENFLENRVETYANNFEPPGQDKYWHTLYQTITGNLVQIELTYLEEELQDPTIFSEPIQIHAIAPTFNPASVRLS